ncbi:MAG: GNAT family N-acetyltransferase [Chloroflexota bacterium]
MSDERGVPAPTPAIEVVNVPGRYRFEARIGGEVAGISQYLRRGSRVIFTHTEVSPEYEGRGVGSAIAKGALDAVREAGGTVEARCPFIAAYLKRHPEYADLIWDPAADAATGGPS